MKPDPAPKVKPADIALMVAAAAVCLFFYACVPLFDRGHISSAFKWMVASWNEENGYTHGFLIFPVVVLLLWHNRRKIAAAEVRPANAGIYWIVVAALMYVLAARLIQPRISIAAIPFLGYGIALFLWGRAVARHTIFPLAMIFFAIPVPGLIQATNGLQLLVTKAAYQLATWCQLEVGLAGNQILLHGGGDFKVDEGCSGIRSLTALLLIAFVYGYFFHEQKWKRLTIFLAAVPIAIVTNILRIFSIIVVARKVDENFARGVYHDYSGFVSFGIGLVLVMLLSAILTHGFRLRRTQTVVIRKGGPPVGAGPGPSTGPAESPGGDPANAEQSKPQVAV